MGCCQTTHPSLDNQTVTLEQKQIKNNINYLRRVKKNDKKINKFMINKKNFYDDPELALKTKWCQKFKNGTEFRKYFDKNSIEKLEEENYFFFEIDLNMERSEILFYKV